MKILIVDDSIMDRKLVKSLLKKNEIINEILEAADGEEAIKVLSGNYTDICLILLDWQMPKMDGITFMKKVLEIPEVAAIPIVMITASSSDDDKKYAQSVNPKLAQYVVKPYKPEVLLAAVRPYIK